ncbi:MAG: bidirectional [NiFe] hydrogenase diaphorase subunit [Thermacetogenium sp.]|jgi:NADH dehydrogenase/NADH:ubiquinone oxidoreductase subunit G|nr:bidirectional [NiFe] hydrogenase diaphorase subunit [Thermacetogenium sp.]MDN5376501.1 bidirectional [NiFe] hydrogenase diaphorase subunit [Thermacetogenium sp.]
MMITINGREFPARDGETVLEVARREGIWIPTLCHHEGLNPYGSCRICVVEVTAGGRPGLTASCTLPVSDGLVVETDSERVRQCRQVLVRLLLAMAPNAPVVRELAEKLGVTDTPFKRLGADKDGCILCGLCVRTCEQVGAYAIGFAFRGVRRRITPPFGKQAAACMGCRACEQVCPTGTVKFTESGDRLFGDTWQAELQVVRCPECGAPVGAQPLFVHVRDRLDNTGIAVENLCPICRRKKLAGEMAAVCVQHK